MVRKSLIALSFAVFTLVISQAQAKQFAMVVGINDYVHFGGFPVPAGQLSDLRGAENDAKVIAEAVRAIGIDLPDSRFLLNRHATLAAFLDGWHEMVSQASPGDTLLVTFAGHGGQEREVSAPFDETTDGLDETIMFTDFDPANPRIGRLSDDQLRKLLIDAAQFNVIWVMDSCHSAGLTRSVNVNATGISRNGGKWTIAIEPVAGEVVATTGDGDGQLAHVTQILATATEDRQVDETLLDGRAHGALSWFFAKGIRGDADRDQNGQVTRSEIANYLDTQVVAHMNQNQRPRILPRGDSRAMLDLVEIAPQTAPEESTSSTVRVKIIGAPPVEFDSTVQLVQSDAALIFEETPDGWTVYNHTGDIIKKLTMAERAKALPIVARAELISGMNAMVDPHMAKVGIQPKQDAQLQKIGALVGYTFVAPTPTLNALTLFNLAGDGTLQYLYPGQGESGLTDAAGFDIDFRVSPPTGADQLVAIFCDQRPHDLQNLLKLQDGGYPPTPEALSEALAQNRCQIGRTGLFTTPQ